MNEFIKEAEELILQYQGTYWNDIRELIKTKPPHKQEIGDTKR